MEGTKRPLFIAVIAILLILNGLSNIAKVLILNKAKLERNVKWTEDLMRNGVNEYDGRTIYWKDKSEFEKKATIQRVNFLKKELAYFSLMRISLGIITLFSFILAYGLFKMKKWVSKLYIGIILFFIIRSIVLHGILGILSVMLLILVTTLLFKKTKHIFIH